MKNHRQPTPSGKLPSAVLSWHYLQELYIRKYVPLNGLIILIWCRRFSWCQIRDELIGEIFFPVSPPFSNPITILPSSTHSPLSKLTMRRAHTPKAPTTRSHFFLWTRAKMAKCVQGVECGPWKRWMLGWQVRWARSGEERIARMPVVRFC